jgi:hypothetical protein
MSKMKAISFTQSLKAVPRIPLRSEFARGASFVMDWKVKLGDQKAWQSWQAAAPQAALCSRHARPRAPCNAAPLDLAAGESHRQELCFMPATLHLLQLLPSEHLLSWVTICAYLPYIPHHQYLGKSTKNSKIPSYSPARNNWRIHFLRCVLHLWNVHQPRHSYGLLCCLSPGPVPSFAMKDNSSQVGLPVEISDTLPIQDYP